MKDFENVVKKFINLHLKFKVVLLKSFFFLNYKYWLWTFSLEAHDFRLDRNSQNVGDKVRALTVSGSTYKSGDLYFFKN